MMVYLKIFQNFEKKSQILTGQDFKIFKILKFKVYRH